MQKVERNAPCPCGSQKKYKHCCLAKSVTLSSLEYDVEWQRLRQIEGNLWEGAFAFAKEEWGPEIVQDGWGTAILHAGENFRTVKGYCQYQRKAVKS